MTQLRPVFVDTSAFLPLIDLDDSDHAAVVAATAELARDRRPLLTASHTLIETGALVRKRLGVDSFRRLGEMVRRNLEVHWVDEELHWQAWKEAASLGRNSPGLVDCVGFLTMKQLGLDTALALDPHFAARGFRVLPAPR